MLGRKVDEKVWRLPLHKNFDDNLMNSSKADMQNINYTRWSWINYSGTIFTKIHY